MDSTSFVDVGKILNCMANQTYEEKFKPNEYVLAIDS